MGTSVCDYSQRLISRDNRLHRLIRSLLAVLGLVVAALRRGGGGGGSFGFHPALQTETLVTF